MPSFPRRLAAACAVVAASLAGPGRADGQADGGDVAVQVGDAPIFRSELDAAVQRAAQGRDLAAADAARLAAETVEQLVNERLLEREVEEKQIAVDEDEVTEVVTRMRGQLAVRRIPIETFLAQVGRDENSLRGQIRLELGLNKLLVPQVTAAALDAAFARHHRDLDGTLVRASHVVLRPDSGRGAESLPDMERRAAAIRARVLKGEIGFADAARRHSAGPSRRQGGDLGFFPRHGLMDEEFARQAFALAKGEMSKPFVTAFGVHVVLVTDIRPGDVRRDVLRPQLEKLVLQEAIREIVDRRRRTTTVEYAPGVPHFAPDDDPRAPARRVIMEKPAAG